MAVYDVFISYSSADRALAESVHAELVRAELTVWRDRDRLVPGERFTQQIFDALRQSHTCLCLVSEDYLRSGYANQEVGAARERGVRLFPVRIGSVSYEQLVGALRDNHVPAYGQDIPDAAALAHAVAQAIVGTRRGIRESAAPSLPAHYVERAELRPTVERLAQSGIPWFAIAGRPGSGRSTFAVALLAAIAPSVDQRVFWVERQTSEPDLRIELQRQLVAQLTDSPPTFDTWQEGRRLLRRYAAALPRSGRCVLIVDDADAQPDILQGFDIDERWTVIAVGHDPAVFAATIPPACVVKLGGLSVDEAVTLAEALNGDSPVAIGADARMLFEKIDRLPAAVALSTMLARNSIEPEAAWRDLLDAVTEGALRELDNPAVIPGGLPALVKAALRPLNREQTGAIGSLAVFPDRSCFDTTLLAHVWSSKKERQVRALASRLRELSLLDESQHGLRVPSLVRTFLRRQKDFPRRYTRVVPLLYEVGPLIAAILWNDRDVFARLLAGGTSSRPRKRSVSATRPDSRLVNIHEQLGEVHALHVAVEKHRLEMVAELVRAGVPVDVATDRTRRTPLHLAIHHRAPSIAALLLDRGANPNWTDAEGLTPLHIAAEFDDVEIGLLLLDCGADPRAANPRGNRPLHLAALFGGSRVGQLLISRNADLVADPGEGGARPVLFGALRGHTEVLDVLLSAGANPNETHPSGETALIVAVRGRHEQAVERLLAAGADVHRRVDGITALYIAAQQGHTGLVRRLLDAGSEPSGGCLVSGGTSAIHPAAAQGYEDIVRMLVEAGESVHVVDGKGHTPLHYSAQVFIPSARTSTRMSMTETGISIAAASILASRSSAAVLNYLLRAGARVDAQGEDGNTALHVAAIVGASEQVAALLAAGADRTLRNSRGLTPADEARRAGRAHIGDDVEAF